MLVFDVDFEYINVEAKFLVLARALIVYQIATAVVFIAILSGSTKQQVTEFRGTDQQLLHLRVVKLRLSQAYSVQFRIKYSQFPERKVSP